MDEYQRTRRPGAPAPVRNDSTYQGTGTKQCQYNCHGYVLAAYRNGDLVSLALHHPWGHTPCSGMVEPYDVDDPTWNPKPEPRPVAEATRPPRGGGWSDDSTPAKRERETRSSRADLTADGRKRRG